MLIRTTKLLRKNSKRFRRPTTFFPMRRKERSLTGLDITTTTSTRTHHSRLVRPQAELELLVSIFRGLPGIRVLQAAAAGRVSATYFRICSAAAPVLDPRELGANLSRRGRCQKRAATLRYRWL